MLFCIQHLLIVVALFAQLQSVRPVPPAYSTYVPPAPELKDRIVELEQKRNALKRQIEDGRAHGSDITEIEKRVEVVEAELESLGILRDDSPENQVMFSAVEVADEMLVRSQEIESQGGLDLENSQKFVNKLYEHMGLPDANMRIQDIALSCIETHLADSRTPPESRMFLRNSLVDYSKGGGGQGHWFLKGQLALTLGRAIRPDDEEGVALLRRLSAEAMDDCRKAAYHDCGSLERQLQRAVKTLDEIAVDSVASSDWPQDAREALESLHELERRRIVDPAELKQISARLTRTGDDSEWDDAAIRSLLRAYRRILYSPPAEVSRATVTFIEEDLIVIAKLPRLHSQLRWKYWKLWAETVLALQTRASPRIRQFVAEESARLSSDPVGRKSSKSSAFKYASRRLAG